MLRTLTRSIVRPIARTVTDAGAPAFYVDFLAGQSGGLSFTRATTASYFNASGVLQTAASGAARIDHDPLTGTMRGLLREPARTNRALWSRDLTNVAWIKTSVTAAKTQVGLDGVADSASSITATGANGTCLQAVTSTSAARALSAYVKRLVGTGDVQITLDNGLTWTTVTVTAGWTRVSALQTLSILTFGFRLVTSGDSIAVDYAQLEDGSCPTSAIPTTTVAVTRDADVIVLSGAAFSGVWNAVEGSASVEAIMDTAPPSSSTPFLLAFNDGTTNERINLYVNEATAGLSMFIADGGSQQTLLSVAAAANYTGTPMRLAGGWALNNVRMAAGGTLTTLDSTATMPTATQMEVGAQATAGASSMATPVWFRSISYWPQRLPDAALADLTRG
jgi:hypothetical protein